VDGRKNNKGQTGSKNKGGRPSKAVEQKLIEKLTPMSAEAHKQLKSAINSGEQWAVKLWFEYFYGKPKQSMDVSSGGEPLAITINEVTRDEP
jgi:hypothetical protein